MATIFYVRIRIETNTEHKMGVSNFYGHDLNFSFFSNDVYIFYCIFKYIDALPLGKGSGMVINDDPLKSSLTNFPRGKSPPKSPRGKGPIATKGKFLIYLFDKFDYSIFHIIIVVHCNIYE